MKRLQLGKILFLLMTPLLLWGSVKVGVDKNALYRGDSVTYTISVTGSDIEFPTINAIDGTPIESTSSSQNIRIINGDFQKTISKSYTFTPEHSLEIPSYKVLVDGGVEMTQPVPVKIVKPSQDKSAPVVLDIKLSKTKVHVGEMVRFDLVFKKKPNVPVYKLDIEEPKFEDFWVKKLDGVKEGVDGEYTTQTYSYLLFAQKSGTLKIPAVTANVGQLSRQQRQGMDPFFNSAFGQQVRYTKVFSNPLSLEVEALPNNLELYGDFDIKAAVDKTTVLANKPVNLTVSVDGIGNIDDVQKFTLDLPGAVVYANEPVITSKLVNGKYVGHFEQKIVVIADSSYTIPPLQIRYFDQNSQKEAVKESSPIAIKVTGSAAKAPTVATAPSSKIESAVPQKTTTAAAAVTASNSWQELLYAAAVGFVIGALFIWLLMRRDVEKVPKAEVMVSMEKRIQKCKSDKELFELLLPYKHEGRIVAEVLCQLEENLYRGTSHTIDKKALIGFFKGSNDQVELP